MSQKTTVTALKINVRITTHEIKAWFGKSDGKGKNLDESRFRAVATVYDNQVASTEYMHKTEKAAVAAVKSDIAAANA